MIGLVDKDMQEERKSIKVLISEREHPLWALIPNPSRRSFVDIEWRHLEVVETSSSIGVVARCTNREWLRVALQEALVAQQRLQVDRLRVLEGLGRPAADGGAPRARL